MLNPWRVYSLLTIFPMPTCRRFRWKFFRGVFATLEVPRGPSVQSVSLLLARTEALFSPTSVVVVIFLCRNTEGGMRWSYPISSMGLVYFSYNLAWFHDTSDVYTA